MQLRYLQTLNNISAEKNSTIVFPVPIDLLSRFLDGGGGNNKCAGCHEHDGAKRKEALA